MNNSQAETSSGDAVTQALADRPDLEIPQDGETVSAADAMSAAVLDSDTAENEIPSVIGAASTCFQRRG